MDTKWKNSDFKTEMVRSKYFSPFWKQYYESDTFHDIIKKLHLRGDVRVVNIDQSENEIFQKEAYLDSIIALSSGTSLKMDEKTNRHGIMIKYGYGYESGGDYGINHDMFPVEVWSNPNKDGKHDGWGYHIGTTIAQTYANYSDDGFMPNFNPVVYTITSKFVDDVIRNETFSCIPNTKTTNNLYRSGYKWVPRKILEDYFP